MTGFRNNRRAVLKRIPSDAESKNFDISHFENNNAKPAGWKKSIKESIGVTAKVLVDTLDQSTFRTIMDDLNRVHFSFC